MKIRFYSTFREHTGCASLQLDITESSTIKQVIDHLVEIKPQLRRLWFNKNGDLHGHVHITLNQVDIFSIGEGLETQVKQDDVLDFFPPISGGISNVEQPV